MPPQVKRTDAGTGPLIELEEVSEETPVGLAGETIPTGEVDDASLNFVGEEIPEDKWTQDEDGNIIIPAESESENFVGEELTLEGAPKYKDGIYTLEGFKEWEQQEKEEGRDGFWHWATKTLPEASKEAFSYLYEGGKQIPDKFKEDPLKATAIFPEAALSAAEGWVDIATGAADLAQRPFRAADENQKARYERYKMFAERTKRILEDRKSRVGDAIRSAGYLLDKDFNEYAAKYDEGINPASADTLGIVLDPGALFGGGIYRTAGRVVGRPSIAANKALNNVIKGINQGTTKKIFDVAKETLKRPATQTAKGAGTLVDYAGKGIERIGQGISNLGQEGRLLEKFPQTAKGLGEVVKIKGGAIGTPGQIVSVMSEAAQKGGRRQTGLGIVKKKGTLRDPIQKGVQLLDTPLSDKILRNAGDLADKITKGTAIGMGTGYVAGGAEGAAAGAGFGAFGGGLGYGAEKAAKYTPLVRNKFRGMERLKLDEEFITDYASRLPEDQRKAFLNPDRRMGVSDLAAEADAAQLFQGYMSKKGSNVDVKYTNGEGMVKAASSDPDNPNLNARFQYGFYDKKSNTIHINTDASGTGRNRTLFHELFHPTEYFSAPSKKRRGRDKGEQIDPFAETRAELEQTLFGTFDEAGNRRSDGLYTDKQMLDFENQYLDAVFQQNQNSPLGRKITEARKIRDEAIKQGDAEATDQITYLLGQYELQKRQNKKAKENYLKGDIATRRKNITSEILSEHFANFGEQSHFGLLRNAKDVLFKNKFNKNTLGNKLTKLSLSTLGGMRRMLEGKGVTFDAAGNPKGDFKAESKIFIDPLTGENLITSPEFEHLLAQYVVALDTVNNRLSLEGSGFDTVETAGSLKDKKRSDLTPEREKQLREIGWLEDFDGNDNPIFSTARKRNKEHKEEVAKVIDILNANPEDSGETKMWRKAKTKAGRDRWEGGIPSEKQMEALRNSDIDPTYVEKIEKIRNAILKGDGTIWGNDYYKAITGGGYDSKAKVKFSLIVPFSLEATQAGNINIKSLNLSKLEAKIKNYAEQRPAFFEAWGRDPDAFRKDIVDFFQGPSRGKLFPEGERKDLIYQFLNIKNKKNPLSGDWVDNSKLIESNRIERSTNLKPYDDLDKIPFDYGKMLNRQYMPEPKGEEGARFMPPPAPTTPQFKRFFEGSKVVDSKGEPLVVYSGHGNTELYGTKYNKNKGTSGGFYATEDPSVASSYARGKIGDREFYEDGSEYRFLNKSGNYNKKIWQIELTPEQQAKAKKFLKEEAGLDVDKYWEENARYDREANRARLTGGVRRLSNVFKFMESMGDTALRSTNETVKFENKNPSDPNVRAMQDLENQGTTRFEDLLNEIGLKWNAFDRKQPGVFPLYLSIKNPLDANKPFPEDVLTALKKSASRERPKLEGEYWTKDLSMKEFVDMIEEGSEFWSTQVPSKAKKIFQEFGYDGIKELGNKKGDGERQTNWIAFEPEQIKSTLNRGEFSPENPDIRFMPAPTFFSKAERAVEGAKAGIFNKEGLATVDQAKALLQKNAPQTELEWSGVLDYLDLQKEQGNKVSKDDLLNYIKSNGVEIEEVQRGAREFPVQDEAEALNEKPDPISVQEGLERIGEGKRVHVEKVNEPYKGSLIELFDPVSLEDSNSVYLQDIEKGEYKLRKGGVDTGGFLEMKPMPIGMRPLSGNPTLFKPEESFTMLPGGENYRELVLKLPEGSLKGGESEYFDAPSGHRFPEDNILAHIRFTERIDADGKKMLFLEEVQSDWASEGRRSGFKKKRPAKVQRELDKLMNEWGELEDRLTESRFNEKLTASKDEKLASPKEINQQIKDVKTRIEEIETEYENILSGVPDMPYKGSKWEDLVMKRMIRYAADNGYERLGWITGKDTADRYNLSKQVNDIMLQPAIGGERKLIAHDKKGNLVVSETIRSDKDIEKFLGKGLSNRLLEQPEAGTVDHNRSIGPKTKVLEGDDLQIGGVWAENLYDKSLPSKAKKITKKKGAVGRTKIGGDTKKRQELADELKEVEDDIAINKDILSYKPRNKYDFSSDAAASAWDLANISEEKYKRRKREIERKIKELDKKGEPEANYVDITSEVKEIAEEGFSYFMPEPSSGGTNLKGFINDVQNLRNFEGITLPPKGGFDPSFHINTKIMEVYMSLGDIVDRVKGSKPFIFNVKLSDKAKEGERFLSQQISDFIASLPDKKAVNFKTGKKEDPYLVSKKYFPEGEKKNISEVLRNISDFVEYVNPSKSGDGRISQMRVADLVDLVEMQYPNTVSRDVEDLISMRSYGKTSEVIKKENAKAFKEMQNPEFKDVKNIGEGATLSTDIIPKIKLTEDEKEASKRIIENL